MNSFTINGEISKNCEYIEKEGNKSFVKVSITHSEKKNKGYYNFVAFGNIAKTINDLKLNLGDIVTIESSVIPNNYTDKNGNKVYGWNFVINKLDLEERVKEIVEDIDTSNYTLYSPEDIA